MERPLKSHTYAVDKYFSYPRLESLFLCFHFSHLSFSKPLAIDLKMNEILNDMMIQYTIQHKVTHVICISKQKYTLHIL